MSRRMTEDSGEVRVGSDHVTIRRPHQADWYTARILHRVDGPTGDPRWVVLDRRLHRPGEDSLGGFAVSGAVTTELRA